MSHSWRGPVPVLCPERRLHATKVILPTYAESFRCIGSACEDTCCQGWTIVIDREAKEKYERLPESPLRTLIRANILFTPKNPDGSEPDRCATIRMSESNRCPVLSEDGLCRIQTECGEEFLPSTCATYPRVVRSIGNIEEKALALSCPEAARLVLLNPALLDASQGTTMEPRDIQLRGGDTFKDARGLQPWFWPIRESVLGVVGNRAYPLWQRLFLVGVLCRQLDAIAAGGLDLEASIPAFLCDFEATVSSGTLLTAMAAIPVDIGRQLDVVLRLAGMLLHQSNVYPRFAECIKAFTAGIGNGPGATFEGLTAHYTLAHDRCYEPFFERHPYILENYVINTIFRCQFPFGREGMRAGASPSMTREYVQLTAQFALMKGLLIGVAGCHGEAFSTEHVVHTVQAASRHFEHHTDFLNQAHALLVENQMDGAAGSAILLRNSAPAAVSQR
jgi:lysine-N-methylase